MQVYQYKNTFNLTRQESEKDIKKSFLNIVFSLLRYKYVFKQAKYLYWNDLKSIFLSNPMF